jgi:tetratricopeptide (TPR) repeat protein
MGERFLFIPSLGFLIAIVALIERLTKASFNADAEAIWKNGKAKIAFGLIALFFIMGFTKTMNRNKAWENNTTLYETDIVNLENCARTQYNYACLLHANYYKSPSSSKQEKILYHYSKAVQISDRSMKPMLDLGSAYMEFGNFDKGKEIFLKTIDAHPRVVPPLNLLGKYYLSQNNFELALGTYRRAKEISETSDIIYSIAYCLMKLNKIDQAIEILVKGENLAVNDYRNFELLSVLRTLKKDYKLALYAIEKALRISPNNESLLKNRDWILINLKSKM